MASGDVVNTAARLQAAAPVNGILVGEATYRATRETIEYREAEPVEAEGKAEPIPVWEAVSARSRFGIDLEQRKRSELVGRERELGVLGDALARCRSELSPQLMTLVGGPGIGKSRLGSELFQMVDADPDLIGWRQGRSLPYGEGLNYRALGEILKAQAGILESDPLDAVEAKLRAMVDDVVPDAGEAEWVKGPCGRSSGSAWPPRAAATAAARPSRPGGGCSRRSRSGDRSCSCSRTCTGPTTGGSTPSTTSPSGRVPCRCCSSVRRVRAPLRPALRYLLGERAQAALGGARLSERAQRR